MRYALLVGGFAALALGYSGPLSGQGAAGQGSAGPGATTGVMQRRTSPRPRARLGVVVDIRRRATDSLGAFIEEVRPGSPADRAGIRGGDIVTKFDGQPMRSSAADPRPAGLRLISLAARLEPNESVAVELRRGRSRRTVSVVIPSEMALVVQGALNDSGKRWSVRIQPGDLNMASLARFLVSPLAALETAALNPDLGQYFGTTEGVLVITPPLDSQLGLRGGDVILTVNGRKPSHPADLMRMLQGHQPDKPIRFIVLRHRERIRVTIRLDGSSDKQSR
jgi:S1-C subfamily serine protease